MKNGLLDKVHGSRRLLRGPLVGYPGARITGTPVIENLHQPELQVATLKHLVDQFGFDLILPFMDLSVEAEALGLEVLFHPDGAPDVRTHPVQTPGDLAALSLPDPASAGRMPVFTRVIAGLKAETAAMVGGYASSPFTLAGLLMGAENLAIGVLIEPDFCHAVLDFSTRCVEAYATAQQDAGADLVVLLDPTAVLLSPALYDEFVRPYVERVSGSLNIPAVLHVCGQTTPIMDRLAATDVAGLSLDSDVDLPAIMDRIKPDMVVIGNVNPVAALLQGSPETVRMQTSDLIRAMKPYGNFILSTGCDVPLEAPTENIEAFMRAEG